MKKRRLNSGFTMVELLVVVAIIGILSGVGMIAVTSHQRSMKQLEWDGVAKEIFVAAQNHLTMAEGQGYPGITSADAYGTDPHAGSENWVDKEDATNDLDANGVYYFTVADGKTDPPAAEDMFNLMLPFGSVDQTVRNGCYIVRYRVNPGTVLDVFYWSGSDAPDVARFKPSDEDLEYKNLYELRGDEKKSARRGKVIGWYGVDEADANNLEKGPEIVTPSISVDNGDKLIVKVTEPNASTAFAFKDASKKATSVTGVTLKLIVTGEISKAKASIEICQPEPTGETISASNERVEEDSSDATVGTKVYMITLDDISRAGMHFAEIKDNGGTISFADPTMGFIPGENIIVQAVAYSNDVLTNIAFSSEVTTNSLFADISKQLPEDLYKAQVAADEADATASGDAAALTAVTDDTWKTAMIGSFRHLENLDASISKLDLNDAAATRADGTSDDGQIHIVNAIQIADLDWAGFVDAVGTSASDGAPKTVSVSKLILATDETVPANYLPVTPSHCKISGDSEAAVPVPLNYDGRSISSEVTTTAAGGTTTTSVTYTTANHSITGIVVSNAAEAGLFGTLTENSSVANVDLIDFDITTTGGNAGALAGTLGAGSKVSNVLAYNSIVGSGDAKVETLPVDADGNTEYKNITASASAGGLVGAVASSASVSEPAAISQSAAALYVKSPGGDAGGLIGSAANAKIDDSYSGGHTKEGAYSTDRINVSGVNAGGLIGSVSGVTSIEYSYSTCSAEGSASAGGLIGKAGAEATDSATAYFCYAIGDVTVSSSSAGAKKGTLLGDGALKYRTSDGEALDLTGDEARYAYTVNVDCDDLDDITKSALAGEDKALAKAIPYDAALPELYDYPSVEQLHKLQEGPASDETSEADGDPADDDAATADDGGATSDDSDESETGETSEEDSGEADAEALVIDPVQIHCHYGDWSKTKKTVVDTDLRLINAERLSAEIDIPADQIEEGKLISLLVHGDTSEKEAYLVFVVTKSAAADSPYSVVLSEKTVIPGVTASLDGSEMTDEAIKAAREGWLAEGKANFASVLSEDKTTLTLKLNFDDITRPESHFTQLFPELIPGENISVMAKGSVKDQANMNAVIVGEEGETKEKVEAGWSYTPDGETEKKNTLAARTNSLFADPYKTVTVDETTTVTDGSQVDLTTGGVAAIANIRHLENLDARISGLDRNDTGDKLNINSAKQIEDLAWTKTTAGEGGATTTEGFVAAVKLAGEESVKVYRLDGTVSKADSYFPVAPTYYTADSDGKAVYQSYALTYNGQSGAKNEDGTLASTGVVNHSITGVTVDVDSGDAGLFESLGKAVSDGDTAKDGCSVSNLALIDFNVKTASGNAGALAGTLRQGTALSEDAGFNVSNVAAYNSAAGTEVNVSSTGEAGEAIGSAGGLIGLLDGGNAKVEKSAAALTVSSAGGNAGGLIGTANGGSVAASYSGGHTSDGMYYTVNADKTKTPIYNVSAPKGIAGGLIGVAGTDAAGMSVISYSYSTSSATGTIAGGLVGTYVGASNSTINHCYATGLVEGTVKESVSKTIDGKTQTVEMPKDGAFAYSLTLGSGSTVTNNWYFEIINERESDSGFSYLAALGKDASNAGITALDADASAYNTFVGAQTAWKVAVPYDGKLTEYYGEGTGDARKSLYNLETVEQLGATLKTGEADATEYFVSAHYGDWPAPETFVVNTK